MGDKAYWHWGDRRAWGGGALLGACAGRGARRSGCTTLALRPWFHDLTAFDFAEELPERVESLARERGAPGIRFFHGDAMRIMISDTSPVLRARLEETGGGFGGALFLLDGLMQITGRSNRRAALGGLCSVCRPGAPLLLSTHDRNSSRQEQDLRGLERVHWEQGLQDTHLMEFGDRYFADETGRTFILESAVEWPQKTQETRKQTVTTV